MNKEEKKKRKHDIQIKVWNLMCVERSILDKNNYEEAGAAYLIREVLDLISPNWRKVEEYKELEVNIK